MRQLSFEACCAASGFRVEWDKDFSCFISGSGLYEALYLEGSITTPRRFADALARQLDLPENAMSNPIIPDEVYIPGEWNDGNIEKDIKMWNNALESKDTMDQPELTFLTCRLGDCLSGEYTTCQAPFEGRAAKRYVPVEGETIQTTEVEGKEVKRLIRGKLPAFEGKWLCPLELEKTPFWEKLSDSVEFKISKRNIPKLDDVMSYFKRMSLKKKDDYESSDDEEEQHGKRRERRDRRQSKDEGTENEGTDYDSCHTEPEESDEGSKSEDPNEYDTDDGASKASASRSDRREREDPVQKRRNWREDHKDDNPEGYRKKPFGRYNRRGDGNRGEPEKGSRRDDREDRRHNYRRYDDKPYYKKDHYSGRRDDRSDRRRSYRDDRRDNRRRDRHAKKGIDVGKDYNSDLRSIFNRSMPDEAILETLKNPDGKLMRMMQARDKSTTKPLILKLKNFKASGPKCRRPTPFDVILKEIDELAKGQTGTAATLLKQLYTDFVIDPDGLGCTNRSALRHANMSGF